MSITTKKPNKGAAIVASTVNNEEMRVHPPGTHIESTLQSAAIDTSVAPPEPANEEPIVAPLYIRLIEALDPKGWVMAVHCGANTDLRDAIIGQDVEGITVVEPKATDVTWPATAIDYSYVGDLMKLNFAKESIERILMMPPLERERDLDFVERGVELLAPGGILVAVSRNHDPRRTRIRGLAAKGDIALEPLPSEGADRALLVFTKST